ncbi:hypothetical protein H4582DRAFT_1012203 [Lactarius indigo]|nr:hypothetical protein H4582DRAFT_1012203 [Lactarius indigo]
MRLHLSLLMHIPGSALGPTSALVTFSRSGHPLLKSHSVSSIRCCACLYSLTGALFRLFPKELCGGSPALCNTGQSAVLGFRLYNIIRTCVILRWTIVCHDTDCGATASIGRTSHFPHGPSLQGLSRVPSRAWHGASIRKLVNHFLVYLSFTILPSSK